MKKYTAFILYVTLLCNSIMAVEAVRKPTTITGNKKLYDKIMSKVENRYYDNFYVDSVPPIRFYSYIFNDSSKHLLTAVFITGTEPSPWEGDISYLKQRYGHKKSGAHYWEARLYEENKNKRYGWEFIWRNLLPFRERQPDFLGSLCKSIRDKRQKKDELVNALTYGENRKINLPKKKEKTTVSFNTSFRASGKWSEDYQVIDTIYQGEPCYKLIKQKEVTTVFGEQEQKKLEQMIQDHAFDNPFTGSPPNFDVNELRRLESFWGNTRYTLTEVSIFNKSNYALLFRGCLAYIETGKGEKFLNEQTEEHYVKEGKKYKQKLYKTKMLLYDINSGHKNDKGIYSYRVKVPLDSHPPKDSLKAIVIRRTEQFKKSYDAFCTRVDTPDEEMLVEWNKLIGAK